MLTVACVLSEGLMRSYLPEHVTRLQAQVAPHLRQPYRFLCLTNANVRCESVPLVSIWPGWFAKLELFRPGLFKGAHGDRVLYLDLDVTVTGSLDDLADFPAAFAIIDDWNRFGFNSSVMAWDAGVADHLYTEFNDKAMDRLVGDQDWITQKMPGAAKFPRDWCVSYKLATLTGKWPADQRVCVHHGVPKPWDLTDAA